MTMQVFTNDPEKPTNPRFRTSGYVIKKEPKDDKIKLEIDVGEFNFPNKSFMLFNFTPVAVAKNIEVGKTYELLLERGKQRKDDDGHWWIIIEAKEEKGKTPPTKPASTNGDLRQGSVEDKELAKELALESATENVVHEYEHQTLGEFLHQRQLAKSPIPAPEDKRNNAIRWATDKYSVGYVLPSRIEKTTNPLEAIELGDPINFLKDAAILYWAGQPPEYPFTDESLRAWITKLIECRGRVAAMIREVDASR
jgi:hypothetical protein